MTDLDGRFRASGLADGEYEVAVNPSVDFSGKRYRLTLSQSSTNAEPLDIRLVPFEEALPVASVRAAELPTFPVRAIELGVAGTAFVRLSMRGDAVADIDVEADHPLLGAAARATVSTWRFEGVKVPVLAITYQFELLPGDCSADQRPTITMRLPITVEIQAKRVVKCG
jgi:hypothetical protein